MPTTRETVPIPIDDGVSLGEGSKYLYKGGELQFEYIGIKLYGDKHATDMKGCIIIKFCSMNRISSQTKNRKKKKSQGGLNY